MEDLIFKIFIFCMFIIMGVLLLGFFKYLFKYSKVFISNRLWMIKILSIFPLLCLVSVNYIIVLEIIENRKPELIIAILLGSLGSHFIFKDN
jgi:hypothetical protein